MYRLIRKHVVTASYAERVDLSNKTMIVTFIATEGHCRRDHAGELIDNSEHVPAIRRIADAAQAYLISLGIPSETCKKVKKELIARGRDLFIEEWIRTVDEDDGPSDEEGRREARKTFDELLESE